MLPAGLLEDYAVTAGDASKKGVHYLTADGGRVPNLGESRIRMITKEQFKCNVLFQVAEIQKPILSVSTLTAMGNVVSFTRYGGTVTNLRTKRKLAFKRRGGVYILEVLVAPGTSGAKGVSRSASADSAGSNAKTLPGFTRPGTQ